MLASRRVVARPGVLFWPVWGQRMQLRCVQSLLKGKGVAPPESGEHPDAVKDDTTPCKPKDENRPFGPKGATFAMFRRAIEEAVPFNKFLGFKLLDKSEDARVLLRMPSNPNLIGDQARPALHGGSLAALIDTTAGFCAWTQLPDLRARLSTADLRIDYLRPAPVDVDMICEAHVQLAGRRLIWVDARVYPEGREEHVVAIGRGSFAVKLGSGAVGGDRVAQSSAPESES